MRVDEARTIAVLGAGVMGHGIAEVASISGFTVNLYDVDEKFVDAGLEKIKWSLGKFVEKKTLSSERAQDALARIRKTLKLEEAVGDADVVLEAAPEDIKIKNDLFAKVDSLAPSRAVFASNTSTLPISEIGAVIKRPSRLVGIHFFNPTPLMPLVEVVKGEKTSEDTLSFAMELGKKFGKDVVLCKKDVPGFIVNRLLGPLLNEAAWLVSRKQAKIEQIDSAVVNQAGLPMGLFELADYSGVDTIYRAAEAVSRRDPTNVLVAPLMKEKYDSGKFGRKTGEGFYKYSDAKWERPKFSREAGEGLDLLLVFAPAINAAAWLLRNGICTEEDLDKSVKLGLGFPRGILQMADAWGVDRVTAVLNEKQRTDGKFYTPDPLLAKMVADGKTGVAAGKGFYDYSSSETKFEELMVRRSPPLCWIVLNRPHRLNTINQKLVEELSAAIKIVEADPALRVVVIAGEGGRAFSAGADLSDSEFTSPVKTFAVARRWFEVFTMLEVSPKPVIAAIDGYALGGGCELALACDFRLASEGSQLGLTETRLGLIPGAGGTQRLVRLVGLSKAKEMIFFGEKLTAEEAFKVGLVNHVYKKEEFQRRVNEFASRLAKQPPISLKLAKYATTLSTQVPIDIGQLFEAGAFGLLLSTQDASEGISALFSKREPEFKGE